MRRGAGRDSFEHGRWYAQALTGNWRREPPPWTLSADALAQLIPLLRWNGEGGLAWWRAHHAVARSNSAVRQLCQDYRLQTLWAIKQEERIQQVFRLLRGAGVEPILIKGWANARLYAEPGLRTYGDIDLCVRPEQLPQAQATLTAAAGRFGPVDLHRGTPDLPDRTWEQVHRHSRLMSLGREDVRILGAEDHLRLVCLHLVRHGAWRPLWLCDVAAALEARPMDFDWDYCLSGKRRLTRWVIAVLGLACRLLDARLDNPSLEARVHELPSWLVDTVLWRWATGRCRQPFRYYLGHPWEALQGMYYDGLNPIKAAFRLGVQPRNVLLLSLVQLVAFLAGRIRPLFELHRRLTGTRPAAGAGFVFHHEGTF